MQNLIKWTQQQLSAIITQNITQIILQLSVTITQIVLLNKPNNNK